MPAKASIAIDIGRRRLRAVQGTWERDRLRVRRALSEPLPGDLDRGDPRALGEWVGRMLEQGRFEKGRVTVAVSREHVVLKRLTLPTGEARELPEMTRLALSRDLPFDADDAVIDFVCVKRGSASTAVLAVAAPDSVLSGIRQAARYAGLGVEHVSLRSMGTAAIGAADAGEGEAVLVVDVSPERVEFNVVVDGVIRFSRAGTLPDSGSVEAVAEAVVTECRRTWMSYRIADDSEEVKRALVIGDRRVAELVAGRIHYILQVETAPLTGHPRVECAEELGELWPLAGLLLAARQTGESIDFANPHRPPDVGSRRRRVAIAGAGAAAIVGLAGLTFARFDLQDLRDRVAELTSQKQKRQPDYFRYGRDRFKLQHLQQWESARPDWLAHLQQIVEMTPPADRLVLDDWEGTLTFKGVRYDRRENAFSAPRELGFGVEGEAADRSTADGFRGRLVERRLYDISTLGPDAGAGRRLPFAFQYQLRTTETTPVGESAAAERGAGS